jgi:flagellar hook assembly protein FlgD
VLTLTALTVSAPFFSPNNDGIKETTRFTAVSNYDEAWILDIKNSSGTTVRAFSGVGAIIDTLWNGLNDTSVMQAEGLYDVQLTVTAGSSILTRTGTVVLDNTPPVATITTPLTGQVFSNVYRNGSANVEVAGTISDANLDTWILAYGGGTAPGSLAQLRADSVPVNAGQIFLWDTLPVGNGVYTVELKASDLAGTSTTQRITVTVGNFKVSQNVFQLNSATGGTVSYTSTVPFPITETIEVKNAAGTLVRTLVSQAQRATGTFTDTWNGRSDTGEYVGDGPYSYFATATAGSSSMVWDTSNTFRGGSVAATYPSFPTTFDPFNNVPLAFNYSLNAPYRVAIQVGRAGYYYGADCAALAAFGTVCVTPWEYKASGTHSFTWWGTAADGSFLPGKDGANVIYGLHNFPTNVVVLFGTAPVISNARVTRPLFGPAAADPPVSNPVGGPQSITFNLATFQGRIADVTVRFVNQASVSALRTITMPGQAAGPVVVAWDGKADNGMWVAPGFYTAIITVTDPYGSTATQHVVMNVEY